MSSSFTSFNRFSITLSTPFLDRPTRSASLKCHFSSSHRSYSARIKTLSATAAVLFHINGYIGGGGNGGAGGNTGGGGGSGGDPFWSRLLSPAPALADEPESQEWNSHGLPANIVVQLNKMSGFKKYKISDITFFDLNRKAKLRSDDSFVEMVTLRSGGVYTKAQLQKEVETMVSCGMFEKIEMAGKTNADGSISLTISFTETKWPTVERFRCINVGLMEGKKKVEIDPDATDKERLEHYLKQERDYKRRIENSRPCLLPASVQAEIAAMLRNQGTLGARLVHRIRDHVEKWYHDEGYSCARVATIKSFESEEIVCEVLEGDITKLSIKFLDKLGNVVEGNTQIPIVQREIPRHLHPGYIYNIGAAKQALRKLYLLRLFSRVEVNRRDDETNEGGIVAEVKLKERNHTSADFTTEWTIVSGGRGRLTLASIQPGVSVSLDHLNLQGLNKSFHASLKTRNLFGPQDDLSFKLEYAHPYFDGVYNPSNRTLRVSCFNVRKRSPVFTGGPYVNQVPPIWVDRAGIKANITENITHQSKFTYGLVMTEITTRDGNNIISSHGRIVLPNGEISAAQGPPTTLSGTGIDRMAYLQTNITRDNTKYVNGAVVGVRNVFQVDQGLGIGTQFPFFNRHQLTVTRFIPLKSVEEGAGKPPPLVLVLHCLYGGCVGDLPSYNAFALGGPYSVRGYRRGEIGAARNILELAAELRVPIKGKYLYGFAEHGNDLGSSKNVNGNPTVVYRRVGHGSSYGVGINFGMMRAEYAVDCNTNTGAFFFRFGERY
ncbi:Protein TOC75, chloroplastic, partial [Mucuna pruriens]